MFFCYKFSDNSDRFSIYLSLCQAELHIKITVGERKILVSCRKEEIKDPCDREVTDFHFGHCVAFPSDPRLAALRENTGCLRFLYAQLSEGRSIQFENRFLK